MVNKLKLDHPRHLRSADFKTKLDGWKANLWKFYEFYRSAWPAGHKGSAVDYMLDVLGIEKAGSAQQPVPVDAGRSEAELLEGARKKKNIGIKSLSEDEIQALAYRAAEGDRESIDILLCCFEPLFQSCAKEALLKLPKSRLKADDLTQEGRIYFDKMVKRFDPLKGSLITFTRRSLNLLFIALILRETGVVHIPAHTIERTQEIRKAELALMTELGRPPSDEEMANKLDSTVDDYHEERIFLAKEIPLEEELFDDGLSLIEVIPDDGRFSPPDSGPSLLEVLEEAIEGSRLTGMEMLVLREVFFENRTYSEVGRENNMTCEGIRQTSFRALAKIRRRHFAERLKEYLD
ncbi:hypothetical protein HZC35_02120 [Candidatus Saganbacteria bacterium]|nr:hypothetical protein [Candidatus Saganbacteria bacterium]